MTRLEELKAKRNNNDITRTALPDTTTINNQPTRLEQLKASMSPPQMSATPVQKPTNNAFNILNNATKVQSYNDVTPINEMPGTINSIPQNQTYNNYTEMLDAYDSINARDNQQVDNKYSWLNWDGTRTITNTFG